MTSSGPRSANADPFLPQMTTNCISVNSLVSPSLPCLVPVTSHQLPLSTLHQYFPLATGIHHISGQQLVTLARSSMYNITRGKLELSNQAFCIPFLGTEFNYVVTEDGDLDIPDGDLVMSEIVSCLRNIQTEMRIRLTEVQRVEEMVKQVLEVNMRDGIKIASKSEASLILEVDQAGPAGIVDNEQDIENEEDGRQYELDLVNKQCVDKEFADNYFETAEFVDASSQLKETFEQFSEQSVNLQVDFNIGVNRCAVSDKDENQTYVDDYGFSDNEDDDIDHTCRRAPSPNDDEDVKSLKDLKDLIDEQFGGHRTETPKKTMFSEQSYTPVSLKQDDKSSPSSRPRGRMDMLSPGEVEMELKKVNENLSNHIIHFTIINAIYPIDVSTLHKVCRSIGEVDRLTIFEKGTFVQALVEFRTIDHAIEAKKSLHGCDIYNNVCTLKVEFSKHDRLDVWRNDEKTWDFTQTVDFGKVKDEPNVNRKVLLNEGSPSTGLGGPSRFGCGGSGGLDVGGFGGFNDSPRGGWGGGYQMERSPVLMVYYLDPDRFNCQRLFNLLCLYGSINKISFLKYKEGCAMVEFSDPEAVDRAARNLNRLKMFGVKLKLVQLRKTNLEDTRKPHELPDGSDSFKSFFRDRNNRFDTPERAAENRILPPTKILHFYNFPKMDDDRLIDVFAEQHAPFPTRIKWFEAKSESGLAELEFDTVEESVEALVMVNNTKVQCEDEGRSYDMKLCFS